MNKEDTIKCFLDCKGKNDSFQLTLTNKDIDVITNEIERLHSIIKEAKEFIYENAYDTERENCIDDLWGEIPKLLEILDKEVIKNDNNI